MPGDTDSMKYLTTASSDQIILSTFFIAIFLMFCFFFSLLEGTLNFSDIRNLKHISSDNSKTTARAVKILNHIAQYSTSAQTGFTLNAAAVMIIGGLTYFNPLKDFLLSLSLNVVLSEIFSAVILAVIIALFIIAFTQITPKKLAAENPEKTLLKMSGAFMIMCAVISPLVMLFSGVANLFLRIAGKNPEKKSAALTEEKILMMVDEGEENGVIEGNTKNMIENVFEFDDTSVGEVMTHRKDVVAVEDTELLSSLVNTAIKSGRSRIPVYHKDIDNIIGIIYVKDLLKYIGTNTPVENIDKNIIHKAVFVPESKRCSEMFEYMTSHKTQIAVVVDEFGGTGGIITMEDLIESIVGNIQDEYDNEDNDIKKLNEYSFTVDGATSLDEISDLTGIDFDGDSNDTIAGIMLDRMGHIPKNGEHPSIMIDGTRFTVQTVENRRISQVLIVKHHQ